MLATVPDGRGSRDAQHRRAVLAALSHLCKTVAAGRGAGVAAFVLALVAAVLAHPAAAITPFVVKDIRVEGVQRTEAGTVFSYLPIKVGDTLRATYYDNVVLRLRGPKDPPSPADRSSEAVTKTPGAKPGGVAATQRTIVATIDAIDPAVPSISFKGPNGWAYTSRVQDKKVLEKVKAGDKVDITWTEALMISFERVAK